MGTILTGRDSLLGHNRSDYPALGLALLPTGQQDDHTNQMLLKSSLSSAVQNPAQLERQTIEHVSNLIDVSQACGFTGVSSFSKKKPPMGRN
jgi:hypothetical protein